MRTWTACAALMPEQKTRRWSGAANLRAEINRTIDSGDLSEVWKAARPEVEDGYQKKQAQRKIAIEVREEIAEKLRDGSFRGRRLKEASLPEILELPEVLRVHRVRIER